MRRKRQTRNAKSPADPPVDWTAEFLSEQDVTPKIAQRPSEEDWLAVFAEEPSRPRLLDAGRCPQPPPEDAPPTLLLFQPAVYPPVTDRPTRRSPAARRHSVSARQRMVIAVGVAAVVVSAVAFIVVRADSEPMPDGAPPVATPAVTISALLPEPSGAPTAATERAAVQDVLDRYRRAFGRLNSAEVRTFWPNVNMNALDKAFGQLERQDFEFDTCRIDLVGSRADASCAGTATFVPQVGGKTPRVKSRRWAFQLVRENGAWIIQSVESR